MLPLSSDFPRAMNFTLTNERGPQDDGAEGQQSESRDKAALRTADLCFVCCEDFLV